MGKRDKSKLAKNATKNIYNKDQRLFTDLEQKVWFLA